MDKGLKQKYLLFKLTLDLYENTRYIIIFYHDSAASLIENGKVIAAVQRKRFTRIKHDANFPKNAIKYCENSKLNLDEIDFIVFEKPFLKFERLHKHIYRLHRLV